MLAAQGVVLDAGTGPRAAPLCGFVLEFPRTKLRPIGEAKADGPFLLRAYEATGIGSGGLVSLVAGRTLADGMAADLALEFLAEMRTMETLRHANVVAVVGVVTVSAPALLLTEWTARGRLSDVVSQETLSPVQLLAMAQDVASGMEYITHRRACAAVRGFQCQSDRFRDRETGRRARARIQKADGHSHNHIGGDREI